jgi:hypothetical protein
MPPAAAPAPTAVPPAAPSGKTVGIIAGVVAVLVVIGVGGYFGYRMLFPSASSSRVATSVMPASTAPEPAPVPEPPKNVVAVPKPPAQDAVSMKSAPATPPDSSVNDAAAAKDLTAAASTKAPGAAAPTMDATKTPPTKASNPPGAPGSSPPIDEAPAITAQGRTSSATAQPDRWQQMREAMARCAGDNFFKRVACEQGVGQQFCEGFWGKVPQCPSGLPTKDRGQ